MPFNSDVGNESEYGTLKLTIMHRPGNELLRLRADNLDALLFDAIPNINETHESHGIFTQYLRDNGVEVLYVTELLRETLIPSEQARHMLIQGIVAHSLFNLHHDQENVEALRQWLLNRTPEQLVEDVIAGVAYSQDELGTSDHAQILLIKYD
jgi:arginine deiminase